MEEEAREAAVAELRRAAEDGRLDPASLDARVAFARAAGTPADLVAALHGLASEPGTNAVAPSPSASASVVGGLLDGPGHRREDPLNLVGGGSTAKRSGPWEVPPFVRVQAAFSSVRLDLLDAVPLAPVIDLQVGPGLASIRLVLPPGWAVDLDRLGAGVGSAKSTVPTRPDPGCPLIRVRGSVGVGGFKATGPSRRELRRRARGR